MQHPIVVSFVSIIPGLGFIIFERYRQATAVFLLVTGLLLLSVFSPWESLSTLFFFVALGFWIYQIATAVRLAKVINSQGENYSTASLQDFERVQVPAGLSRGEKFHFRIKETLRQQLELGETLVECISGMRGKYGGVYYLGLSDKHFLISELDMFSGPLYVIRVGFSAIERVQHNKGVLQDTLVVHIKGEKPIRFEIPGQFKDQLFLIVKTLEGKTA